MGDARGWDEGEWKFPAAPRVRFQFYKMKRVLMMDGGDDSTTI